MNNPFRSVSTLRRCDRIAAAIGTLIVVPVLVLGAINPEQQAAQRAELKAEDAQRKAEQSDRQRRAELRAQQKEARKAAERAQSALNISGAGCDSAVKRQLRDPGSYRREQGGLVEPGQYALTFRARNGFGGYTMGAAICTPGADRYSPVAQIVE